MGDMSDKAGAAAGVGKSETGVVRIEGIEAFIEHTNALVKPALRQVDILTEALDPAWLGEDRVIEQLKQTILKNRRSQIRLLIADSVPAVRNHHPLLALIRRLDRIEARVINKDLIEKQPLTAEYLLVDRGGIIVRQSLTDFLGFVHFDDRATVRNQREAFEVYWRYSHAHADFRHLQL
jgi:hypothetical protein